MPLLAAGASTNAPVPALPADVRRQLAGATSGGLESRWVWIGLAAAAVAALAGLVWWCRRRPWTGRRAWLRRIGGALLVAVLAVAAGGAAVNSYVGYFPTTHSLLAYLDGAGPAGDAGPRGYESSQVVEVRLGAPRLGVRPGKLYVYLPPRYADPTQRARRYPVVYLFPGYPGRSADWFAAGAAQTTIDLLIRRGVLPPMILVSPDTAAGRGLYDSECLDGVGGEPRVESFLTGTVVSYVDSHYRTVADRRGRALSGMSSGAFCALNLGLRHTEEFSVIGAIEPFGDPGRNGYAHLGWRQPLMLANTPARYIPRMRFRQPMAVLLDAPGADHSGLAGAQALADMLVRRGQRVALRVEPDQTHTWRAARAALPYVLLFAAAHLDLGRTRSGRPWQDLRRHHHSTRVRYRPGSAR